MKTLYSFLFFLLLFHITFSQTKLDEKEIESLHGEAEELLYNDRYYAAIDVLLAGIEKYPTNPNLNFLLGFSYLNTRFEKPNAIFYLKKAIEYNKNAPLHKKIPQEAYYFLAKAYHYNYEFENAIKTLEELKTKIKPDQTELLQKTHQLIRSSKQAIQVTEVQIDMLIENIAQLNSPYDDHSPLVTADESTLIFTSRRKDIKGKLYPDQQYSEDIYMAFNAEGEWSAPLSLGNTINTQRHESAVSISADGTELYIYRADRQNGSIYVCKRTTNGLWDEPQILNENINTKYRETSATISADGQTIVFTSDRPGGQGGMDLYMATRQPNGQWGTATNLGKQINSTHDELGPNLHQNGTLFFSSNGHTTMGGFDVFSTTQNQQGHWEKPYNMGYPINTVDDDFFYFPNQAGERAYYSSEKAEGNGKTDIYSIRFDDIEAARVTVFSGYVRLYQSDAIEDILIYATDYFLDDTVGIYTPNPKTGKYVMILPSGRKYKLHYAAPDFLSHQADITVDAGASYLTMQKILSLGETILYPKLSAENSNEINSEDQYIFSIHLISSDKQLPKNTFDNIRGVKHYEDIQGNYNYYYGTFTSEAEAARVMQEIETRFPNAFIFINDLNEK